VSWLIGEKSCASLIHGNSTFGAHNRREAPMPESACRPELEPIVRDSPGGSQLGPTGSRQGLQNGCGGKGCDDGHEHEHCKKCRGENAEVEPNV